MSPPSLGDDFQTLLENVGEFFVSGAELLDHMMNKRNPVLFGDWSNTLREKAEMPEGAVSDHRLVWLWDTLRTTPEFQRRFGCLAPAAEPWAGTQQRFKVFDAGEWFVIGMKGTDVASLVGMPRHPIDEKVSVKTKQVLFMKPGKGGRLECCDCQADVSIRVNEVYAVAREADIMRIEESQISLGEQIIKVHVDSLNQAYTVSSRRLEPNRRSHGGRTYDHVVYHCNGIRVRLEDIRKRVESGTWEPPQATSSDSATGITLTVTQDKL